MQPFDIFVGGVAIVFGLSLVLGAALNGPWLMQLGRPRMLVESLGPRAARIVLATIGGGLIVLGIAVARGWRVHWG